MSESGDEDSFALVLVFVAVPEVKTVESRLQIDLAVTNSSQDNEVERLVALGARRIAVGQARVLGGAGRPGWQRVLRRDEPPRLNGQSLLVGGCTLGLPGRFPCDESLQSGSPTRSVRDDLGLMALDNRPSRHHGSTDLP
jgi:hypothetical protein